MVNRLFYIFVLLPFFVFSGEFTATINKNSVGQNEALTLTLTLKDASTSSVPSTSSLSESFVIHSQKQFSNMQIINGQVSSSMAWKISLMPKKEGELMIPSIPIETSEGTLATEPISVTVVKGDSPNSSAHEMSIDTVLSKENPYKNEPVFFTVRLISKVGLANVGIEKFTLENAIVEPSGEPKTYEIMVGGISNVVVEWNYVITPLKAGAFKIPSLAMQGQVLMKRKYSGSFDDDFGPFFNMAGFDRLQPFTLRTEEKNLEIKPPIAEMNPWLPAKSLKIEEIWDSSVSLRVGEPITRGFTITAEGLASSQLSFLSAPQIAGSNYKIYSDKPEFGEEVKEGSLSSFRKEQYTLIPEQAGESVLPEISIAWWDVIKKEKVWAKVPSRTLHVLPGIDQKKEEGQYLEKEKTAFPLIQEGTETKNILLISVVAGLLFMLLVTIFWGIVLQKKIKRLTAGSVEKKEMKKEEPLLSKPFAAGAFSKLETPSQVKEKPKKDKNEKLPDLNPT